MNRYGLVVKGEVPSALRKLTSHFEKRTFWCKGTNEVPKVRRTTAFRGTCEPIIVTSVQPEAKWGNTLVQVSSDHELDGELNEWFHELHGQGPPFLPGALLYWHERE